MALRRRRRLSRRTNLRIRAINLILRRAPYITEVPRARVLISNSRKISHLRYDAAPGGLSWSMRSHKNRRVQFLYKRLREAARDSFIRSGECGRKENTSLVFMRKTGYSIINPRMVS